VDGPTSVEIPETDRIRRFAYEKWVYFFEKFCIDGEEEIIKGKVVSYVSA
jgi:hypothetical protein